MVQEVLSAEDQKRVNSCDHYCKTKEIMAAVKRDKDIAVGEVYFIKSYNNYNKAYRYETYSYGGKPSKYMVFHRDDKGFVFVKRINANGKLGKIIDCLTTQYPQTHWEFEPDPEYVESIIFDTESEYDPLKAEKEMNKKKGKASRRNKKLKIDLPTALEAFEYAKGLKVGDKLWRAKTTYGQGIEEYKVTNVVTRKVDKKQAQRQYGGNYEDRHHLREGLSEVVVVTLVNDENKKNGYSDIKATFDHFWKNNWRTYYKSKPYTTDDF